MDHVKHEGSNPNKQHIRHKIVRFISYFNLLDFNKCSSLENNYVADIRKKDGIVKKKKTAFVANIIKSVVIIIS